MAIRLPDDETEQLAQLTGAAREITGRAVSASAWFRGAVRLAAEDDSVARRIVEHLPETGRGGARKGAGRPKGSQSGQAEDDGRRERPEA